MNARNDVCSFVQCHFGHPLQCHYQLCAKYTRKSGSGRSSNRQSAPTRKHSTFFSHRICGVWESAKRVGHGKDWIGTMEATERNCLINHWILCFSIRTVRSVGPIRHSVAVPFGKSASEGRHKQIINCEKLIPNWLSVDTLYGHTIEPSRKHHLFAPSIALFFFPFTSNDAYDMDGKRVTPKPSSFLIQLFVYISNGFSWNSTASRCGSKFAFQNLNI